MRLVRRFALGIALAAAIAPAWADEVLDRLRALVNEGRANEAYALAQEQAGRMGEPEFDLFFGLAAIETGRAGQGVLALERYRLAFPQDQRAGLYLARGYLALGEPARARAELEAILADSPTGDIADAARTLLDAARAREAAAAGGARFYVEAGAGTDSNVNGGTGTAVVTLPVFGPVVLPDRVVRTGDNFTHLAAGGSASRTLEPGLAVFGGAELTSRNHFTDTAFDQSGLGGHLGVSLNRGGTLWRATASHHTLWLENDRYRSVTGLAGEWAMSLPPAQTVNAFLQYARFEYGAAGAGLRDADFWGAGVGLRHGFAGAMRPTVSVALTVGDERNDRNRPDFSRTLAGLQGVLTVAPASRWSLSAAFLYQDSRYDAADPFLGVTRKDSYRSLTLGAAYLVDRNLSVRGELAYTDNDSNIALFKYDRTQAMVKLRYEFQ